MSTKFSTRKLRFCWFFVVRSFVVTVTRTGDIQIHITFDIHTYRDMQYGGVQP